jgi:small-conductance mechanosensitive channel
VFVFASTTLTLLGVALFASWSLLSNVTAYFVILLNPSFRRGTFVRIIDVDNYSEGYISELSLFSTKLVTESREVIIYPNNLLLGRPTLINPRDRLHGIGKLPSHTNIDRPISQPTTS